MKKHYLVGLALIIIAFISEPVSGQNYFTQSFDGSGLPAGWSNSTYIIPGVGCLSSYGCAWYPEPGSTGTPGPATHSGAGYMFYNSHAIDTDGTADLITPVIDFSVYTSGANQVSFWMYRNFDGSYSAYKDSVVVYVNTSAGVSGGKRLGVITRDASLSPTVIVNGWYKYIYTVPSSFSGSSNYIIFRAYSKGGSDIYLDDVSVDHIPPCSGSPTVSGILPTGPLTRCVGAVDTLIANVGSFGGLQYQWQVSNDTGATWVNILNDTNQNHAALTLKTILYRVNVKCASSGLTTTSSPISIFANGSKVKYATLPYSQSFESWLSHCDNNDMPDSSWTIFPVSGNDAWRRDDEGVTYAGWTSNSGTYSPAFYDTAHSARFHSYDAAGYSRGEMNVYVNCNADTVHNKELRFYYMNNLGLDILGCMLSTDSGLSFTSLGTLGSSPTWYQYRIPFFSKSPRTVIKFIATSDNGVTSPLTGSDLGIDKIQVLAPCAAKPSTGTINSVNPCYGALFYLSLSGTTEAADLTYRWQQSNDSLTWTDVISGTNYVTATVTFNNTYYRAIVKCTASGQSDTSAIFYVKLKPFYYCYCNPLDASVYNNPQDNIGNVTITALPSNVTVMSNGSASPIVNNSTAINSYTIFDTAIAIPNLYLDSLYRFAVTEISKNAALDTAPVDIYIDLNHNSEFDPEENIYSIFTSGSASSPIVSDTFRIPDTAIVGITGMRVKIGPRESGRQNPCVCIDASSGVARDTILGEYEDYLVNISYPPCTGPLNAGKIKASEKSTCIGYPFKLADTTHETKKIGTTWNWQISPDSITWYDLAGTVNKDTLTQTFAASVWYRVKMICIAAADTTYSDTVHITQSAPYKCYCASYANGAAADTSDIGAFTINGFVASKGGPHLNNAKAIYDHENFFNTVIDLWADSTYETDIYYIMRHNFHADARITLFMDFDNNHQYDVPQERVLTTTAGTGSYISANITIPHSVFEGVPTGMRLIVNNNVLPNVPSDNACGTYTSGETMDFLVKFNIARVGIDNITSLQNFMLYPNPANNKLQVEFNTLQPIKNLQLRITDMVGRDVLAHSYANLSGQFKTVLDVSGINTGIYFVEIIADGEKMIRKLVIEK